jgi:hypothetical protein
VVDRRRHLLAYLIVTVAFVVALTLVVRDSDRQDDALLAEVDRREAEVCTALRLAQGRLVELLDLVTGPRPGDTVASAADREELRRLIQADLSKADGCVGVAPVGGGAP